MNTLEPSRQAHHESKDQSDEDISALKLSRSPHPYHRRRKDATTDPATSVRSQLSPPDDPTATFVHSSSTESGTEADDERGPILKGLPAPPLAVRKGLRGGTPVAPTPALSPLPTPPISSANDGSAYFQKGKRGTEEHRQRQEEKRISREKYSMRRQAEIVRRSTECALLCCTAVVVCARPWSLGLLDRWLRELIWFLVVVTCIYGAYPCRVAWQLYSYSRSPLQAIRLGFRIPSRFDPGPLLYPLFVPVLISIVLIDDNEVSVLANVVLGLSSIPQRMLVSASSGPHLNYVHWVLTLLPLHMPLRIFRDGTSLTPFALKSSYLSNTINEEMSLLFPLHQALLETIGYLTTTSLDEAELELLSTGLIDLLLFATTPQAEILKALIWVGAVCIFITCKNILTWEVGLARIPNWRFARRRTKKSGFWGGLDACLSFILRHFGRNRRKDMSDSDDEYSPVKNTSKRRHDSTSRSNEHSALPDLLGTVSAAGSQQASCGKFEKMGHAFARSNTYPVFGSAAHLPHKTRGSRRARRVGSAPSLMFLSLTREEARTRSYVYAATAYVVIIAIIFVPVRRYISSRALSAYDPFGWALGYLLGNISQFRFWVVSNNLEKWIRLPARAEASSSAKSLGWVEDFRQVTVGAANMRLLICGYCIAVLLFGIGLVLRLTSMVEVDTRRKVFHGIMVAMLLPTISVDPCFIALALILILAIFLLLDLFRASQLPPISKPLMNFLVPYVDGRDHRGPVIVSPMFLLIGCAIPLWLSLAGTGHTGEDPWAGWDVATRDLSMVSGVVCVGMGDAAASLVGRRYGRTKWYWGGGKSLEGSIAFAAAVTVGLLCSYTWLRIGGWAVWDGKDMIVVLMKIVFAASGASLLETTLTAANDNVVVPIGLWLLVKGLQI